MSARLQTLQNKAAAAVKTARDLATLADTENRAMTEAERSEYDAAMSTAAATLEDIRAVKADEKLMADAVAMAGEIGLPDSVIADLDAQLRDPEVRAEGKSLGRMFVESQQFKAGVLDRFSLPGDGSQHIPKGAHVETASLSLKSLGGGRGGPRNALFTGGDKTSSGAFVVTERTDIVEMLGRRLLTLRDLVTVRQTQSDAVEYVVQTAHTNNAAPVAEATSSAPPTAPAGTAGGALVRDPNGGYKPEGSWSFAVKKTTVKTIAEWVPATKRAIADVSQLEGLINDELVADLREVEETQLLTGDGTGENLLGALQTSGIQTMTATGTNDLTKLASARSALTKLRVIGRVQPTAWLANPLQTEWLDTAADAQRGFYGNGPFSMGPRTLWGLPVVESEAAPAGTLIPADWSKLVIWDREQASISMTDSHADFFIRNLVAILAEMREASALTRPSGLITVNGY